MPWRCPACHLQIRHSPIDERPRKGQRYRCHVCRLELVIDTVTNKLTVPPLDTANDDAPARRRRTDH